MNVSPATLGVLRGLGLVIVMAVLNFLANATNLQGVVTPNIAALVAIIALGIEHSMEAKTGKAMFGAVSA